MPAQNDVVSKYFSGQGRVLMATALNGVAGGFVNVGNVSDLAVSVSTAVVDHKETSTGTRGIDLRLTTEVKAGVKMTMESFSRDNLALSLYGTSAAIVGSSVTGEAITAHAGMTTALAHLSVSALTLTDAAVGTTIYTEGTDYTVNPEVGSINILAGSTILDGEALLAAYTYGAYNDISPLTVAQPERWLRFEGLNTAEGNNPCVVDVYRFATNPLAELALIGSDVGKIALDGMALFDANQTVGSKYFRVRLV